MFKKVVNSWLVFSNIALLADVFGKLFSGDEPDHNICDSWANLLFLISDTPYINRTAVCDQEQYICSVCFSRETRYWSFFYKQSPCSQNVKLRPSKISKYLSLPMTPAHPSSKQTLLRPTTCVMSSRGGIVKTIRIQYLSVCRDKGPNRSVLTSMVRTY